MNGKKKLAGWQFGVLLGLLVLMLSTMFMPLFNIDGKVVDGTVKAINKSLEESLVDMAKNLQEELSTDDSLDDDFDMENEDFSEIDIVLYLEDVFNISIERTEKGYGEFIKYLEKEKNIKLTSISPIYIMTKSYNKFVGLDSRKKDNTEGNQKVEEKTDNTENDKNTDSTTETSKEDKDKVQDNSLEKVYNSIRIILIVIYSLCLVVLILTIVGFAASWAKAIPAAIGMIYGFFATVMLIVIRCSVSKIFSGVLDALKTMLVRDMIKLFNEEMALSNLVVPQTVTNAVNKVFSEFELKNFDVSDFSSSIVKFGFIIALILAIVIVIFSLICIFVGGKELYVTRYMPDDETSEGFYSDDYIGRESKSDNPFGDDSTNVGSTPITPSSFEGASVSTTPVNPTPIVTPPLNPTPIQPIPVQQMGQNNMQQPFQVPPVVNNTIGKVVCTKGVAYGQGFQLPVDRKVVVGKSPSKANLVINNQNVSNIHCSIRYNAARNTYIVKDHSTNGTFVNGVRMAKDIAMEYPAGTILSLADGTNQITLG